MSRFTPLILLPVFFVLLQIIQAQDTPNQPVILEYADSLIGTRGPNMEIREFVGNVKLKQGDVNVQCDRAIQFLNENRAVLKGNVHINQKNLDLFTPEGIYYGNSHIASSHSGLKITDGKSVLTAKNGTYSTDKLIADFNQDVRIEDDSVIILADRLIYHKDNKNSFAYGNVIIFGKYTNTYLLGDTLKHFPSENLTQVQGNPRLFQIDTIKVDTSEVPTDANKIENLGELTYTVKYKYRYDTLSVVARYMEAIIDKENDNQIFRFIDSVEIKQKNLGARADTAIYNKTEGIITLSGHPVVYYDSTQLYSDSIVIIVPDMKIKEVIAKHNSIACSREDTTSLDKINQITGDEIRIKFENDSINAIFSYGNAKSLYFLTADTTGAGLQISSCDSIAVYFIQGQVDEINWLGGINGEFHPEYLINNAKDFYLPRFKWSDVKPKKVILKINKQVFAKK